MNNITKIIIALVVVAAIAGGAILLTGNKDKNTNTGPNNTNNSSNSDNGENPAATETITYTDDGFSPATITVKSGDSIRFVNNSSSTVQPSSGPHPVHTANPELNFPEIAAGQSATMTVTTKGTWSLHNHLKEDHHATIIVE